MPWVLRVAVAVVLLVGAVWWRRAWNWEGRSYCEAHHEAFCDGFGMESMAPMVLWPVTALVSFVVCLGAALLAPATVGQRVMWALMIGGSVFVLNSNNLLWSLIVTCVGVSSIVNVDAESTA
jgi:hypothetical protein